MTADQMPSYKVENVNQRTPCVLVLDASGSMETIGSDGVTRIEHLNRGLIVLDQALKADPTARLRVQIAIVSVGGPAGGAAMMLDWTDAEDFTAFSLTAGSETPLAKGLQLALQMVASQKQYYRAQGIGHTRPWIMVITDGEATDPPAEWEAAAAACRAAIENRKCVVYPVGVENANITMLEQLGSKALVLKELKFEELFQWLSDSLSGVSRSVSGDVVQLPPTDPWAAVKL